MFRGKTPATSGFLPVKPRPMCRKREWYPQACKFLKLEHLLHSTFEKSIIERTIQYIKDRTEYFDDYFPCRKNKCRLEHVTEEYKADTEFSWDNQKGVG